TGVYTLRTSHIGYADAARTLVVTDHGGGDAIFATTIAPVQTAWDFESGPQGWTVVHPVDDSDSGDWVWGDPIGSGVGTVQPEDDHTPSPGTHCWVTGQAAKAGDSFDAADVDGGRTVLLSPSFDATAGSLVLSYWRWFTNSAGANPGTDSLHVELSNNDGASWTAVEHVTTTAAVWTQVAVPIASVLAPTATMRLRVSVADRGNDSTVEAAFDDVQLTDGVPTA